MSSPAPATPVRHVKRAAAAVSLSLASPDHRHPAGVKRGADASSDATPISSPPRKKAATASTVKRARAVSAALKTSVRASDKPQAENTLWISGYPSVHYVQEAIHKAVQFCDAAAAAPPTAGESAALAAIVRDYTVPTDFELNMRFGALSGLTHTTRMLNAYDNGLLLRATPNQSQHVCRICAGIGHFPRDCRACFSKR